MNVIILGSGGCISTPRVCCNCHVCTEARQKGFPYAGTGCSLFIKDENIFHTVIAILTILTICSFFDN